MQIMSRIWGLLYVSLVFSLLRHRYVISVLPCGAVRINKKGSEAFINRYDWPIRVFKSLLGLLKLSAREDRHLSLKRSTVDTRLYQTNLLSQ